jgi:hypothetical protein
VDLFQNVTCLEGHCLRLNMKVTSKMNTYAYFVRV